MAKENLWYGKTEEEVRQMDFKTFLQLVPARQRRSLQKVPESHKHFLKKAESGRSELRTGCRDLIIVPSLLGKLIKVYNGKEFLPVTITLDMLGHYLGEFSLTRKPVSHSAAGIGATKSSRSISVR